MPSDDEWQVLVDLVGGDKVAGNMLKASSGWNENGNGMDAIGFSALPGGDGGSGGSFNGVGYYGYWWLVSASEYDSYYAYFRGMGYNFEYVLYYFEYADYSSYYNKYYLYSVRCLQD